MKLVVPFKMPVAHYKVDKFIENVGKIYREKIGYDASFYVVDLGGGPVKLA